MSNTFPPTCLMIKQHTQTGLKYLCKTTNRYIDSYKGSGKRWINHINKHKREFVENIWFCWFFDKESLSECALLLSSLYNIVESDEWANLAPENGLDGGKRISNHFKKLNTEPKTPEWRSNQSNKMKGNQNGTVKIQVGDICFGSMIAAAQYFNKCEHTIYYWVRTGKANKIQPA